MINSLSEKMLDLLAVEADVQQIVNEAARILGNPIMIVDTKFHIMVSSTNLEINIDSWNEAIRQEYVSDRIVSDLEESELVSRLTDGVDFIEHDIPGVPGHHKALRYPFVYHEKNIGFVGLYDYIRPLSEMDKDALLVLVKALTVVFGKDKNFAPFSHDDYEYLLERLLRSDSIENAEWVCDKYANTSFGTDMLMVCMEKDGTEGMKKNVAVDRLKDILQREIYHHYSAVYENRVCMLFDRGTVSDELWERIRKDLVKHAETYGLMAGISYRFSEQKYIPLAYQQAIYALKWSDGASQKKITFFDDCMLDCLVEQCTVTFPAEFFRHPALEKLEQYDREYHTNYLGTLEIYLTNFCSMKATAKALDIHYNTMKYRISMIENIIDESVRENNKLKKQLYFSMLFQKI